MIFGICENFPTTRGAEGGAECADLVGSEGADISFQFLYGLQRWFQCL